MKQESQRAERYQLKSKLTNRCTKLTVHKQMYENIKREVTDLVDNAKTAFFSSKIQASKTCRELFKNVNTINGKKNPTPLQSMSRTVTAHICHRSKVTDTFLSFFFFCRKGLKQGEITSFLLYSLFTNDLVVDIIKNGRTMVYSYCPVSTCYTSLQVQWPLKVPLKRL